MLSNHFHKMHHPDKPARVAVIGAGIAGLGAACRTLHFTRAKKRSI